MSLELLNIVQIIEVMENYVARIRPPEHIRDRLDITYEIENQSIILQEIRPMFQNPARKTAFGYAKTTYVKTGDKWKIYWMRGNLKWTLYSPKPSVASLEEFLTLVEKDEYQCFKG